MDRKGSKGGRSPNEPPVWTSPRMVTTIVVECGRGCGWETGGLSFGLGRVSGLTVQGMGGRTEDKVTETRNN